MQNYNIKDKISVISNSNCLFLLYDYICFFLYDLILLKL